MNRILKILSVLAALAAMTSSAAALELTGRPLAVNESWTESLASSSSMTMTINDSYREQQTTVATGLSVTKQVKVLGVAPNGEASDLEITYTAATINGTALPVASRTYLLSIQGNRVAAITYPGGGTPAAAELEFVERENRSLDRVSAFGQIFGGIATDAWVAVPKHLASRLMNADDDTNVESMSVRFRSVTGTGDDAIAEFDAKVSLETPMKKGKNHKENELAFTGKLERDFPSGVIRVAVNSCRPVELRFIGTDNDTITASRAAHGKPGKHDQMTMSGLGSSSLEMSWND